MFFGSLKRRLNYTPFLMALLVFVLGLVGLGISLYPYVVPRRDHDLGCRRARPPA